MDEQRLAARITALRLAIGDVAQSSEAGIQRGLELAQRFEDWIMRPAPGERSTCDAVLASRHARCPTLWRAGAPRGRLHRCQWLPGHVDDMQHVCTCGEVLAKT